MLAALRRHPFGVTAFFRHSLVLTFAYPEELLAPLLPPGLSVDSYDGYGFVAVALVQTEGLRPTRLPRWFGRDFFLAGYRVFARFRRRDGRTLRGLRILQSYTDRRSMVWTGNLFTGYRYRRCRASFARTDRELSWTVTTQDAEADVAVTARVDRPAERPPEGSPFPDLQVARRFAGPLPHTFGYDPASRSMVVVQGQRDRWQPMPVQVQDLRCTFLSRPPFDGAPRQLANAFLVEDVPYRWLRGEVEPLPDDAS